MCCILILELESKALKLDDPPNGTYCTLLSCYPELFIDVGMLFRVSGILLLVVYILIGV